jgi:hypothetical protein
MRKIPTLFRRDLDNMRRVLPEVTPGCEWVVAGEGTATRKYDGTCVLIAAPSRSSLELWKRREVKLGKEAPEGFEQVDFDEVTGKRFGWVLCSRSDPADRLHFEAFDELLGDGAAPGTYELCGPRINGNPEKFTGHVLVPHGFVMLHAVEQLLDGSVGDGDAYERLRGYLLRHTFEGIVWHHPDGRMAKLKARDFR